MSSRPDYDVVIIGGGMVGLACAAALGAGLAQRRIALLEPKPPETANNEDELDLRVSALAPASQAILNSLGAWAPIAAEKVCAYERMHVWQAQSRPQGPRSLSFAAAETGAMELGHIVENNAVRQALWAQLEAGGQVSLLTGQQLGGLEFRPQDCELTTADGATLTASLVVAADGARSKVREQVDAGYAERSYGQAGVVAHIASAQAHQHTAWQRFLPDGPVALLPLADGRSSLVWSCPEAQARQLVDMPLADFNKELNTALDGVLGTLACTSQRLSFPLGRGAARHYTGHRFALIGDAAHRIHPLAGQGANLGLLDAAQLAETLVEFMQHPAADAGDRRALRAYERSRKGDNLLTMRMMDLLNQVFSSPLAEVAGSGMGWLDRSSLLKSRLAAYATGQGRELPAAAQPHRH